MHKNQLGKTGLMVSCLGIGLSEIGSLSPASDQARVAGVLDTALDSGINFLDTAACYGNSEELVGRTVSGRRDEFVIATKAGHAVGDIQQSWTYETVRDSIERSLRLLRTDRIDVVQLHSCDVDILEKGDVIRALQEAKEQGKTRFIGYSGDNQAALWAVESGLFDTLQTSYNLVDQQARKKLFERAEAQGMGIIAKRPIANSAWGASQSPSGYAQEYFHRYQAMVKDGRLTADTDNPIFVALGFVFANPLVDTAIVGTRSPEHMRKNIQWVENDLPLDPDLVERLAQRFDQVGADWPQRG